MQKANRNHYIFLSNLDVTWWVINRWPYLFLTYSTCLCYFWQQDKWIWIVQCHRQSQAVCGNAISNVGYSVMAKIYSVLLRCAIICESWRHSRDDMNAVTTWNIFKMQRSGSLVWIAKVKDEHGHWINPRLILISHVNASIGILIQVLSYNLRRVSSHSLISTPTEHGLFAKRHKKDLCIIFNCIVLYGISLL